MKINKRKIQYASLSTVFIALFVVVILLVNVLAGFLTDRFSLKLDLTAEGMFSLSEQTKAMLKELDEEITIYIMESESSAMKNQYNSNIVEIIRRYNTASNGKVKYEFVDPNQNPKFYDDFPLAKASKEGENSAYLIVSGARRYGYVMYYKIISTDESKRIYQYTTESELSGAILYVTSPEVSKVAKITGHNETDLTGFENILKGNNIETTSVNLLNDNIPDDVNNILIAGPQVDYTAEEIAKIDAFLTEPGNNVYIFWYGNISTNLPVLERFLSDWGMQVSPHVVLDQQYAYTNPRITVCTMEENDATANIAATQQMFLAPQSHPINILWDEKSYTRVLPLAKTSAVSYARLIDGANANITEDRKEGEAKGPFNVAVLAEKNVLESDGNISSNRVFLFGSELVADERFTGITVALNNTLLNATVSYANTGTKTMAIAPKITKTNDLNFYESQINTLTTVLVFIVPIVILAAGLFIFFRRRHR